MTLRTADLRPAAGPLHREGRLSGHYGGCTYEGCLEAALLPDRVRIRPARWVSGNPTLELPFGDIISIYVHQSRLAPKLEFIYRDWGGAHSALIAPRNLRAWVRHLEGWEIPLRPAGLEARSLPTRSLHYLAQRATLAAVTAVLGGAGLLAALNLLT